MWKQKKNNGVNKMKILLINTYRFYTILYYTYPLLQCKEHNQFTRNHSTIKVETKKNRANKMKTLSSLHIDLILHFITLTNYYNANNAFSSQVTISQQNVEQKKIQ